MVESIPKLFKNAPFPFKLKYDKYQERIGQTIWIEYCKCPIA